MPKMEVEFEVVCGQCGTNLDKNSSGEIHRGTSRITVQPCQSCLDNEFEKGVDKGLDDAKNE